MALLFETMGWTRGNMPHGSLVLITDTLHADGSFLVHHLLSRYIGGTSVGRVSRAALPPSATDGMPLGYDHRSMASGKTEGENHAVVVALRDGLPHYVYVARKLGLNLGEQMKKAAVSFMDCVCDPYSFPSRDLVTSNSPSCPDPSREHSSHMSTGERHLRDMFSWVVREATSPGSCARDNSDIHASTSQVGIQHGFAGCMASDMDDGFRGDGGAAVPRVAVPPGQKPEVSSQGPSGTCVFIDDINALGMVAGYGSLAADFVHYCRALAPRPAREGGGPPPRCSVVALLHRDIPADAMLASALLHAADVVLHVDALETGHAADVHGQVTIEHRTSAFLAAAQQQAASAGTPDHTPPVWPLPQRLQYRVYENSCTFFLPGVFRGS